MSEKLKEVEKPIIVCLCGSTRFYTHFQEANYRETMGGKIVLSVGFYPHAQDEMHGEEKGCTPEQKVVLDKLHFRKIDLADEVLILNVNGYIGSSTRNEILYAVEQKKKLRWLEPFYIPKDLVFDMVDRAMSNLEQESSGLTEAAQRAAREAVVAAYGEPDDDRR